MSCAQAALRVDSSDGRTRIRRRRLQTKSPRLRRAEAISRCIARPWRTSPEPGVDGRGEPVPSRQDVVLNAGKALLASRARRSCTAISAPARCTPSRSSLTHASRHIDPTTCTGSSTHLLGDHDLWSRSRRRRDHAVCTNPRRRDHGAGALARRLRVPRMALFVTLASSALAVLRRRHHHPGHLRALRRFPASR